MITTVGKVVRIAVLFVFFWVTNLIGAIGYFTWMLLLLPLRLFWPAAYWSAEVFVFKGLNSFVVMWLTPGQYGVVESGDDVREIEDSGVLLLANHQSTADVPMTMLTMWPKGWCSGRAMWIMDQVFRYTHFGLVSTMRGDFFIRQGKDTRGRQGQLLAESLKSSYLEAGRKWIIVYPEGGFLWKRREASQRYGQKNGYPVLKHVTLPRIGALKAVMDTVAPPVSDRGDSEESSVSDPERPLKWILDVTIGYKYGETDKPPDMFGMVLTMREQQDTHVHYRAYPVSQVPRDEEGLLHWLYQRYEEKEQLLEHFYRHGSFPADSEGRVLPVRPPTRIVIDYVALGLYQLFYVVSACVFYTVLIQPWL